MKRTDVSKAAQDILQQAQTGPGAKPGERHLNSLSPNLERFIVERIRKLVIESREELLERVLKELKPLELADYPVSDATAALLTEMRERLEIVKLHVQKTINETTNWES